MKYRYPKKNHMLKFERISDSRVSIKSYPTEEGVWEVNYDCAKFLYNLDGETDPYTIDESLDKDFVDELLAYFEKQGWLYPGKRVHVDGIGSIFVAIWIPAIKHLHRVIAKLVNVALIISCLPVFLYGLSVFGSGIFLDIYHTGDIFLGCILGYIIGMTLRELSRAEACLASGAKFYEFGFKTYAFIPMAYVHIDYSGIDNLFWRSQIAASGLEVNLTLIGIFLISLKAGCFGSLMLMFAALVNVFIAVIDLVFTFEGWNEIEVFSELLCINEEKIRRIATDKNVRVALRKQGINGYLMIVCSYIFEAFYISLPVLFILCCFLSIFNMNMLVR